jgi:hypothetical protein
MSLIPILTGRSNFVATGGTTYTQGGYTYHKFTSSGTFTVVSGTRTIEYLVVAGGGSGGTTTNGSFGNGQYTASGAGGGGGVLNGTYTSLNLTVTVGVGGTVNNGGNGGTSSLFTIPSGMGSPISVANALGGGYGATGASAATVGGSGGGGSIVYNLAFTTYAFAAGTAGQGNAGGSSSGSPAYGGGGGGSAAAASGISGGAGLATYTSWWDASAPAQIGKGGNGVIMGNGSSGAANTGNGGGGAYSGNLVVGTPGNGGSGIVIIRYAV